MMKLRTSLQVSALFPVALAIMVTLSIFVRSRSLARSREALEAAETALPLIAEANASLYRHLGSPDDASREKWLSSIGELSSYCEAHIGTGGVVGILASDLAESVARLEQLGSGSNSFRGAGEEMSRMFASSLKILSVSRQQAENNEQASETALLVFIAVFAMLMTGSIYSATSKLMKRLSGMRVVCDQVLKGNTKGRIEVQENDEMADFARSFNALVRKYDGELNNLRSEVDYHREGEDTRDKVSAAAREGNIRLADALTKLKRAQSEMVQQERVLALEQVVKGVAREFNDILAPVLTMSDYLLSDPEKLAGRSDLQEDLRVINASARKTLRQVKVMTDLFDSIDEPVPQRLRMSDIVEGAEQMVVKESRRNIAAYKVEKDFEDVPFVVGNEVDYVEAVHNLIENAFEASDEGAKVRISIRSSDKSFVTLSVRDDGPGMSDEVYRQALEPFFSTKGSGHSGMGLTFAVVAVGRFGGSLDIKSGPDQGGTTVTLTIPVYDAKAHGSKNAEDVSQLEGGLKILVIDDEEWTRVVLSRSLSSQGHDVESAEGGTTGLQKYLAGEFDVVILDRAMPDMSGDEVAKRIAEEGRGTAVVMVTGFGDEMIRKGEVVEGVDSLLSKPTTQAELREAIGKALAARRA